MPEEQKPLSREWIEEWRVTIAEKFIYRLPSTSLFTSDERVPLAIVAEIPDEVNRPGLCVQKAVQALNPVAINQIHDPRILPNGERNG